jgi:hypothetical protein
MKMTIFPFFHLLLISLYFLFCHAYRGAIVLTMAGKQAPPCLFTINTLIHFLDFLDRFELVMSFNWLVISTI